jgi:hypothetical protein
MSLNFRLNLELFFGFLGVFLGALGASAVAF